ncbi:putative nucleotidyltransferase, ribonuclease H, partial [Tanacetum coccineum]
CFWFGNVTSRFAPSLAKAGGGNTGPVSRASSSSRLKCFNCGEPGHRQSECKKAGKRHLFADPEGDDDATYEEHEEALVYDEEPEYEEEYVFGDVGVNLVARRSCLTPKADGDDWLKHNIFESTCTISGKVCTFVCDSGSCDNLIAAEAVQKPGLKTEIYPKPYKLQWLKKGGEVTVSKGVHDPFSVGNTYKDNVWCDVVPMDACHLLLVKITLMPNKPKEVVSKPTGTLLTLSQFEDKLEIGDDVFVLIGKKVVEDSEIPEAMIPLLKEFLDVFPDELPDGLPPLGDIQHHIDLEPESQFPNMPYYRMSPLSPVMTLLRNGKVDESKVAVVQEWPTPTTITEVRSFHGLASFYRRFIPNFSSIMAPLTDCMKGKSFVWMEEVELAFQVFELHTDASKVAIGGVLSQGGRPVAYFSKKLTGPKSRYTTYDLEFYAVVQAVKHWRHYLFHKEFVLFTDHDSLRHIRTQDKVIQYSHGRWLAFLKKFTGAGLDVIRDMMAVDPYFSVVLHGVQAGEKPDFFAYRVSFYKGINYVFLIQVFACKLLRNYMVKGMLCPCVYRTLQWVQASYFWPTMRKEVDHYVKRCRVCQVSKGTATNAGLYMPLPVPLQPWVDISMDFVLGLPRTQREDGQMQVNVAQLFFRDVYRLHGLPSSIVSDRDTQFLSHFWHSLWKMVNTQLNFSFSSAYHPMGKLKLLTLGNLVYSTGFSPFQFCSQESAGFCCMVGLHDVHKAVHENLVRANSKYKQDADHKRRHVDFEEGDFVWAVLTKDRFLVGEYNKLSAKKIGPLEIVEKINYNAYHLKLPSHIRCSDVFNVNHLIPYHGDSSDDDIAMNSRTNFVYPGGMMEA